MFEIEYSDLLFEISSKIGVNQLERLVFMCRKQITKGSERTIQNALELFEKLEKWDKLGINWLETLKKDFKTVTELIHVQEGGRV